MNSPWLPVAVIFIYLAAVLYIGIFAFRRGKATGEDFFVASRSIGTLFFFLSLFATNMTAFAILGSSGAAYRQGIGIFGMMATSSCLVIPLTLFFIGTRLWAVGKRFGHMTQVSYLRRRFECSSIGTFLFVLTAAMLIPYLIISIVGGGTILETLSDGRIPYALGGAIVALVVMGNVFFGGMRGAVWVNAMQTTLFLLFGLVAFFAIGHNMPGGFTKAVNSLLNDPRNNIAGVPFAHPGTLLTRERIPTTVFLSFFLIPLSSIMFPHMSIMCFTARKVTAFRQSVILYPICIMLVWLPCVFLGALAFSQPSVTHSMAMDSEELSKWLEHRGKPQPGATVTKELTGVLSHSKIDATKTLWKSVTRIEEAPTRAEFIQALETTKDPALKPFVNRFAQADGDSVLLKLLRMNVAPWLSGILAAGIISAVMGSDCHQILALSTMFTRDVLVYYGRGQVTDRMNVQAGRAFIVLLNTIAYIIALAKPPIFDLAVSYAFAGFAALSPIMIGALFWKRATKWGMLASAAWVTAWVVAQVLIGLSPHAPNQVLMGTDSFALFFIAPNGNPAFLKIASLFPGGFSFVVPMTLGSALLMWLVSANTTPPSQKTIDRYFNLGSGSQDLQPGAAVPAAAGGLH